MTQPLTFIPRKQPMNYAPIDSDGNIIYDDKPIANDGKIVKGIKPLNIADRRTSGTTTPHIDNISHMENWPMKKFVEKNRQLKKKVVAKGGRQYHPKWHGKPSYPNNWWNTEHDRNMMTFRNYNEPTCDLNESDSIGASVKWAIKNSMWISRLLSNGLQVDGGQPIQHIITGVTASGGIDWTSDCAQRPSDFVIMAIFLKGEPAP